MKDFNKDDQHQTKDKTITIPSIEKEVLLMLCVLAATLDEYGAKDRKFHSDSNTVFLLCLSCCLLLV